MYEPLQTPLLSTCNQIYTFYSENFTSILTVHSNLRELAVKFAGYNIILIGNTMKRKIIRTFILILHALAN